MLELYNLSFGLFWVLDVDFEAQNRIGKCRFFDRFIIANLFEHVLFDLELGIQQFGLVFY